MIIEAENYNDANNRAESIGLYFDGCEKGLDCKCCGDRWYPVSNFNGDDTPSIYGKSIYNVKKSISMSDVYIHYIDGHFEKVILKDEN